MSGIASAGLTGVATMARQERKSEGEGLRPSPFPWFKVLGILVPFIIASVSVGGILWAGNATNKQEIADLKEDVLEHKIKAGHEEMLQMMSEQQTHYEHIKEDLDTIKNYMQKLNTTDYRGRD